MLTSPPSFLLAILAELIDTGNLLDGAVVRLGQADITPNPTTTIADLDECDFGNYNEVAITWGDPFVNTAQQAELLGSLALFSCDGTGTDNTAHTYFVTNTGGTVLLWAERLSAPKTFAEDGDTLPVIPRYTLGQQEP